MKLIKNYKMAFIVIFIMLGIFLYSKEIGLSSLSITVSNFKIFFSLVPPIFLLVGLLDVWVPKDFIIKLMGKESGFKGVFTAILIASVSAGPLYVAFPIAALLMRKQARFAYVLFFLGAWSSTKMPILLTEFSSLGFKFSFIHMSISLLLYLAFSFIIEKLIPNNSIESIYQKAQQL